MISIKNVSKEYITKKQKIIALSNVSIEIDKGESLAVLGLNGAGKSTLVNMITGIIIPTEGLVSINNLTPKDGKDYKKQFSVVYQNNGLDFYLSVYDNLKTNGYIYGLRGKELKRAIDNIIEVMDLQKYRKSKISELSGGYAKRVQVAKALMLDTPIIILDEPTHGMDPVVKKRIFEIINKRRQEGKVIIYTTQILDEVDKICNNVAILKDGHLICKDTVQNTKLKFTKNNVLEINLSNTEKNINFSAEMLKNLICKYEINLSSYELNYPNIKIVSKMDVNFMIQFCYEIRALLDIEELNIKKASLEEILLDMEGEYKL